jgi:putative Ca2+/H+ antiporter (TMEM165/GDT1 family)
VSAGWLEILLVAAGTQLAVLPGEKVQFIIAGLSTKYDPKLVVAAAASAFAGWTAIEVAVGGALKNALPGATLDAITAGLFALFAVMLLRSAPDSGTTAAEAAEGTAAPDPSGPPAEAEPAAQTDGGMLSAGDLDVELFGRRVPNVLGGFLPIFVLMAVGEVGDKTQLVTIGLAAQYGAHPAIWAGEMIAIIPVSLANAYFFHTFSHRFDVRKAHLFGAVMFGFFALDTVLALTTGFSVWETVVGAVAEQLRAAT